MKAKSYSFYPRKLLVVLGTPMLVDIRRRRKRSTFVLDV
jgi:hypothetical protein